MPSPELDEPTLDTVLPLVQQLTLLDKVRLIEYLLPDIKGGLTTDERPNQVLVQSAMQASEATFARIWDNEEDAVYDQL
jgi:hypothetical protein